MDTILVPVAAQVLTDKLPAYAPVADYAAILEVLTDAGVDTVDMLTALAAHSGENIYYRTDHHWTSLGAYYAYCAWPRRSPRGTSTNTIMSPTTAANMRPTASTSASTSPAATSMRCF